MGCRPTHRATFRLDKTDLAGLEPAFRFRRTVDGVVSPTPTPGPELATGCPDLEFGLHPAGPMARKRTLAFVGRTEVRSC